MKKTLIVVLVALLIYSCKNESKPEKNEQLNASVASIFEKMTLEEKLGQLQMSYVPTIDEPIKKKIAEGKVGSILNGRTDFYSLSERNEMQRLAVGGSRLGIPILFAHDVIHGFRTIFPINIAQSCSWSPELVELASSIAAIEASAMGVDWAFAPMVDVSRDPRWGRIAECYGEDTYLNSLFGAAVVSGFQGTDPSQSDRMLACMKHFVGYGAAEGGREYQFTEISERSLREIYLPSFKAGIDAGAASVMSAFNDISGIPASANSFTLDHILRDEWKFDGVVVSDWESVVQLMNHGVAADPLSAAMSALQAGVDIEMNSFCFELLKDKIASGQWSSDPLDRAVKRVLFLKQKAGLFENPYVPDTIAVSQVQLMEHRQLARKLAAESMVLLKNENILPLDTSSALNVAVVGPFAAEKELMGWWKSLGQSRDVVTPIDGLRSNSGRIKIQERVDQKTDIIILCLGEAFSQFGENNSVASIELFKEQQQELELLKSTGKPLVTVIFNGRPLVLTLENELSDAMLLAWHPGTESGNALADIIYGFHNPSGKLTTTFPAHIGQIPMYYNHKPSGRPYSDNYKGQLASPLFPFGYGLSYSVFSYENFEILESDKTFEVLNLSVRITNSSSIPGTEIAQLYFRDEVATVTRPVKQLIDFKRVFLLGGESKEIVFEINKNDLKYWNNNMEYVLEPGDFIFFVGGNSRDISQINYHLK